MTKKVLVFLISFVFLGLVVLAQTPGENFQKAGQAELFNKETALLQKKAEIEDFFNKMVYDTVDKFDHVVSAEEMKTLNKMVKYFDSLQYNYNKDLEFYQLRTATEIPSIIRGLLNVYFGISEKRNSDELNHADNTSQDIRRYFTEKTGYNIIVEKSKDYWARVPLGVLAGVITAIVVMAVLVLIAGEKNWILIPMGIFFILTLLAFMFRF